MTPSRKKVIVRRLAGDFLPGYLAPMHFVCQAPSELRFLDFLDLEGRSLPLPLDEVKLICFVRDFNLEDQDNPERLTRLAFLSRPRAEGLWLRLTFRSGDLLEGLAPQDITLFNALVEDAGIFFTPPDERANTHRIYVPRSAIATLELLAVINAPTRKADTHPKPDRPLQPHLFPIE